MRQLAPLIVAMLCAACGKAADAPAAATAADASPSHGRVAEDALMNKVWILADDDGRPGVMRVFLSDGVLIQDSCWETYRLSDWRRTGENALAWSEDGVEIEAKIDTLSANALTLRLRLRSEEKVERYRVAVSPYVCPDMPR